MPQTFRHCQIFIMVRHFMNQLVLEQKTLSNSNPIQDAILINEGVKILMKEFTWQDIQGLSWIFKEDEE